MTQLSCEAKNCIHNMQPYCCISSICVDGEKALSEAETCCDSFREKKDHASNSVDKEKNPTVDIVCKAVNCKYNDEAHCYAEEVDICGYSACNCRDTRCATFDVC